MGRQNTLETVAAVLLAIGGINWGLAIFEFNLVTFLLGAWPIAVNVVYGAVAASGLFSLFKLFVD